MAFHYSPKIVTNGLVLYLDASNTKSYPESGTDWFDLTRESNNGVLNNGPTFSSSNLGSIVFDGVDDYIDTNFIPTIGTGDITYDIWFKTGTPQTGALINVRSATAEQFVLAICTNGVSGSPLVGSNLLVYSYDGSLDRGFETTETWTDNLWHNVVGVHTSTTDKLYVDGVLRGSVTTSSLNINNSTNLRIGALGDGVNPYPNWYFDGSISNAKVYNKVLTDDEIMQNFNTLKTKFSL